MQFAQTLERLLYLRAKSEKWIKKNFVTADYDRDPNFYQLIQGWCRSQNLQDGDPWKKLLHRIREKRNDVVHEATAVNLDQLKSMWREFSIAKPNQSDRENLIQAMDTVLQKVCHSSWPTDNKSILQEVYEWGLTQLQSSD
jgi:hypothetical protein